LQAWPVLRSFFQSCANLRGRSDGFTLFICGSGLANSGADGADAICFLGARMIWHKAQLELTPQS
jgi:hypothetical protein